MRHLFEKVEWRIWQRLPARFHKWLTGITLWVMDRRLSDNAGEHWAWGMTPMPMGFPFIHQHYLALKGALLGERAFWKIAKAYDERLEREHRG